MRRETIARQFEKRLFNLIRKATVLGFKRRFAFLWSGMHRRASRLAHGATAFGGFGLDPPRCMSVGLWIG